MSQTDHQSKRPLSPHLQVYKLPYNAVMSITGRAVGIGLFIAVALIVAWLTAVVWYPPLFDGTLDILRVPAVGYALFPAAFIVFFYLGNGVRHVLWDFGIGVHHNKGRITGHIVLVLSALLTAALYALTCGGLL